MPSLLYGIAVLACPVGMGLMMWLMMRGQRSRSGTTIPHEPGVDQQVTALRAEIDQLKADRADYPARERL